MWLDAEVKWIINICFDICIGLETDSTIKSTCDSQERNADTPDAFLLLLSFQKRIFCYNRMHQNPTERGDGMAGINIPVGISDFEKIRRNGYYYVDKTGLIPDILKGEAAEVTLITRRDVLERTLGMSMLASFFDIKKDSRICFRGFQLCVTRSCAERG